HQRAPAGDHQPDPAGPRNHEDDDGDRPVPPDSVPGSAPRHGSGGYSRCEFGWIRPRWCAVNPAAWTPQTWRDRLAGQQPDWPDPDRLDHVLKDLGTLPPL